MTERPLPDENPSLAAMIPRHTLESLRRYGNNHVPTGGFLAAVLANDLREAIGRADAENLLTLRLIVQFVFNCLPAACHGSREAVAEWTKIRVVEPEPKGDPT